MKNLNKFQKKFIAKIAQRLGKPVWSNSEILLCESVISRSLISIRCLEREDVDSVVEAEVFFTVQVFDVPRLWGKYTGRRIDKDAFTCSLQLRDVVFPNYGLPDWSFEMSVNDQESIEWAIEKISKVASVELIPLAEKCRTIHDLIAAIKEYGISVHKFDFALLLALGGMFEQCRSEIMNARSLFHDPETGPTNATILLKMLDALALDVDESVSSGHKGLFVTIQPEGTSEVGAHPTS